MKMKMFLRLATVSLLAVSLVTGCGNSAKSNDDVIRIGGNFELTGGASAYGQAAQKGVEMAIAEINEAGGLLGKQVKLISADNKSDAAEATAAVTRLVTQENVHVIIGGATSGTTLGSSQIATDNKVPMITPSGTNESITVENGQLKPWIFRACFIDPFQGEVAATFANEDLKVKSAAIIIDQKSDYSKGLADSFEKTFTASGGSIVAKENYVGSSDKDFRPILTNIIGKNPEMIYVPGYYGDVGLIVKQAREMGYTGPMVGGDGWSSPELLNIAGAEVLNNTYFTNTMAMDDPKLADFIERYKAKNGSEPDAFVAMGYETMMMVAHAIEKAGSLDGEAIRTELENLKDFEGLTGKVTMDPKTHNPIRSAVILKFENGKQIYLTSVTPKN